MGDHRELSYDSRGHMLGFPGHGTIPEDHVVGRAFLIIAPVSRWRILPIPATFNQPRFAAAGTAMAAWAPAVPRAAGAAAAVGALGVPASPAAAGLAAALPLTWLQRRLRKRLAARRERWVPAAAGKWRRPPPRE